MNIVWIEPGDGNGRATSCRPGEIEARLARDDGFLWLALNRDEPDTDKILSTFFAARTEDIEACRVRTPVPRCSFSAGHSFISMNGLVRGTDDRLHFQPIATFYGPRRFATVLGPPSRAVPAETQGAELAALRERILSLEFQPASATELGRAIREIVLRSHEDLVGSLASEIAHLEGTALNCDPVRSDWLIQELFQVRHDLQVIRTNAAQNQELYSRVAEAALVADEADKQRLAIARNGFQHVRNTAELEADYLQELLELFQARVSTELNRFVRQLTAWGAIGVAGTLITGVYGMNFAHMPELGWRYGYPMALAVVVLVGVALALMFRRRGWL